MLSNPYLTFPLTVRRDYTATLELVLSNRQLLARQQEINEERSQAYVVAVSADGTRLIRKPLRMYR